MRWSKRKECKHGDYCGEKAGGRQRYDKGVGAGDNAFAQLVALHIGTGHDGIRDLSRRFGCDSHPGHHGVPSQIAGTVECHCRWNKRPVTALRDERGQATVEFAVIAASFLVVTVALAALWHALGDGLFVEHALTVASHHIQAVAPVTIVDIFLY